MDPSSGHDQEMRFDDQSLESILTGGGKVQQDMMSKQTTKPLPEQALKCPRCDSSNTKFCYYNNYSLSQPRYFCKSCRRYWTKGGTLRNVPVGGGCRKNKRTSSSSSKRNIIITHQDNPNPLLTNFYDSNSSDLHLPLAFAHLQKLSNGHFGSYAPDHFLMDHHHHNQSFLETQGLNHMQNLYYGFADGSSVGEVSSRVSNNNNNQDHIMFPCDDVKQEACSSGRESESRFLLGNFPWQIGGDGEVHNLGELGSSMRGSWNNGISMGSSNWHGLLNSPLM